MSNKTIIEQSWLNPNDIPINLSFSKNLLNSGKTLKECIEFIDQSLVTKDQYYEGMKLIKAIRTINEPMSRTFGVKGYNLLRIIISGVFEGTIATSTGSIQCILNTDGRSIYKRNAFSLLPTFGSGTSLSYSLTGAASNEYLGISDQTGTAIVAGSGVISDTLFNIRPNTQRIGFSYIGSNRTTTTGLCSHQWHYYSDNVTPIDTINIFCYRNFTGTILIYGV